MPSIYIDVELDDFSTDDLINEIEYRGYRVVKTNIVNQKIKEQSLYDKLKADILLELSELSLKELEEVAESLKKQEKV